MSSVESKNKELDFEDKLALFENNFCGVKIGPWIKVTPFEEGRDYGIKQAPMTVADIEPELHILWQELVSHIPAFKNMAMKPGSRDADFAEQLATSGISKEVFKTEIRTTLSQIRNMQTTNCEEMDELESSQKATVRSLKRLLSEKTDQLDLLKRKHRQIDNRKHRLEETVEELSLALRLCNQKHIPLENDVAELREYNAILQQRVSDNEEAATRFGSERRRFQSTIARYREELQLAYHHTESVELELEQVKQRCEEQEKRASEKEASSWAVSARVKELQDVQDAMLKVMQEAKDTTDPGNIRRNLQDLGEKRARLIGKIANLLTKKRHSGTENSSPPPGQSLPVAITETPNTRNISSSPVSPGRQPSTGFNNTGGSSDDNDGNQGPESGNRNPFFEGIRKFGNDLTRVATNRNRNEATRPISPRVQRKTILDNVEKSRLAIEKDAALREVIEMKEKELERMEDELYSANEKAAALERSLQKERHKRRTENRTINASPTEDVSIEASSVVLRRRRSLFDWHGDGKANSSDSRRAGGRLDSVRDANNSLEKNMDHGNEKGLPLNPNHI